jgi:hypothetical protein
LVGLGVDGEVGGFGVYVGMGFEEYEEGVFTVINIVNGEVEACFESF